MTDIINVILNSTSKPDGMPAKAFFTDNNPHGYMSKDRFNKMLDDITKREVIDFKATLEHINCSVPFDSVPHISVDNKDKLCIWIKARLARSNQDLRLPGEEGLVSFLKDYQYGKISPNFTLEELYSESKVVEAKAADEQVKA